MESDYTKDSQLNTYSDTLPSNIQTKSRRFKLYKRWPKKFRRYFRRYKPSKWFKRRKFLKRYRKPRKYLKKFRRWPSKRYRYGRRYRRRPLYYRRWRKPSKGKLWKRKPRKRYFYRRRFYPGKTRRRPSKLKCKSTHFIVASVVGCFCTLVTRIILCFIFIFRQGI